MPSAGGMISGLSLFDPTRLTVEGKVFYASDADQNDLVTGQTTFANTTPTFMLDVPSGTVAIPLMMSLCQAGTVADGPVNVLMEFDKIDRYGSGGTAEKMFNARADSAITPLSTFYSGATANAGYGVRVMGLTLGPDVSPAEGAVQEIIWTPPAGFDLLVGPAAWLVYVYNVSGSTGASLYWTFKWAEIPSGNL